MTNVEFLHIDPAKKPEYAAIVNRAYKHWYRTEWSGAQSFREFYVTSRASFLMYIRYFLQTATPEGEINLDKAQSTIENTLGEYFRQRKFDNAVTFFQDNAWNELTTEADH